ncbi:MAG: hypothetical protein IPP90_09795 [Gemmatimonadaceae bacterium]|nr:hypothetical protein [Gemmatimonadaceae bacterium]
MNPRRSRAISPDVDGALTSRLEALIEEGWALWERFDSDVRDREFHSFVAADYDAVLAVLLAQRGPSLRFLELGSATGVITIMADLLGYEAYGIELDSGLARRARKLAEQFDSRARFVIGSFLPTGYRWQPKPSDGTIETLGTGLSGYLELGFALDDFDVVFGFPWGGEDSMMLDLMKGYGRPNALLLLYNVDDGVVAYRGGRRVPLTTDR